MSTLWFAREHMDMPVLAVAASRRAIEALRHIQQQDDLHETHFKERDLSTEDLRLRSCWARTIEEDRKLVAENSTVIRDGHHRLLLSICCWLGHWEGLVAVDSENATTYVLKHEGWCLVCDTIQSRHPLRLTSIYLPNGTVLRPHCRNAAGTIDGLTVADVETQIKAAQYAESIPWKMVPR